MGMDALLATDDRKFALFREYLARHVSDDGVETRFAYGVGLELELARSRLECGNLVLELRIGKLHDAFLFHGVDGNADAFELRCGKLLSRKLEILAHAARLGQAVEYLVARLGFRMHAIEHGGAHADEVLLAADPLGQLEALDVGAFARRR